MTLSQRKQTSIVSLSAPPALKTFLSESYSEVLVEFLSVAPTGRRHRPWPFRPLDLKRVPFKATGFALRTIIYLVAKSGHGGSVSNCIMLTLLCVGNSHSGDRARDVHWAAAPKSSVKQYGYLSIRLLELSIPAVAPSQKQSSGGSRSFLSEAKLSAVLRAVINLCIWVLWPFDVKHIKRRDGRILGAREAKTVTELSAKDSEALKEGAGVLETGKQGEALKGGWKREFVEIELSVIETSEGVLKIPSISICMLQFSTEISGQLKILGVSLERSKAGKKIHGYGSGPSRCNLPLYTFRPNSPVYPSRQQKGSGGASLVFLREELMEANQIGFLDYAHCALSQGDFSKHNPGR
ncbi:hypothetical protein BOTBODRAFT_143107 [Botryobasidium botryosum FD-172 SS1]|uniref:Uncharacterized protein n=1 Tax=Botryobasidium botryosum (strain FD-172 SS1) TaxID=930990 RepID=A0A067N799_BOTB1|nr:hypothetical protein BOTBODRAFT_143107 [Botryobasidium botryosum FD-172 SS1]